MAIWAPAPGRWCMYRTAGGVLQKMRIQAVTVATPGAEVLTLYRGCDTLREVFSGVAYGNASTNNTWYKLFHPKTIVSSAGTAAIVLAGVTANGVGTKT